MEKINDTIESALLDFDFLFQEGVVFNKKEVDRLDYLLNEFKKIREDKFLKIGLKED